MWKSGFYWSRLRRSAPHQPSSKFYKKKKEKKEKSGSVAAPIPLFVPSSSALLSCVFVRVCACDQQHATPRATPTERGTGGNSDKRPTSALQMHFIFIHLQSGTEERRFGWANSPSVRGLTPGVRGRAGAQLTPLCYSGAFIVKIPFLKSWGFLDLLAWNAKSPSCEWKQMCTQTWGGGKGFHLDINAKYVKIKAFRWDKKHIFLLAGPLWHLCCHVGWIVKLQTVRDASFGTLRADVTFASC